MRRREMLAVLGGTIALAGCRGDDGGEPTSTPTRTDQETGTQAQNLGTIEFTITNEDDETHRFRFTMTNGAGTVITEGNEPEFQPGASVSAGDPGHPPDSGPFTLTFSTESTSESYEWDVRECGRADLRVTITSDGSITIERVLCQN